MVKKRHETRGVAILVRLTRVERERLKLEAKQEGHSLEGLARLRLGLSRWRRFDGSGKSQGMDAV